MKVIVNHECAHDDNDLKQFEISMRVSSKSIKKGKGRYKR
jgi:hypothetical protein